ncbi:MAG: MFS transporter [Promethearchaeota archaeon]
MSEEKLQLYSYRWIVLLLFMFANITMQILWITFAPVTNGAMAFYNVEEFSILFLSSIFMIVYIPVTFLSSWLVEKIGFRWGAGIGALLGGIFGFLRFFAGRNYSLLLIFEIAIAIGQPFLLNSITKLSANWFPDTERTTATGLCLISQFIGILLGFLITPFLVFGNDLSIMLLVYGIVALISGGLFIIFAKSRPPTPPSHAISSERVFLWEGLKKLFTNKYFIILVVLFFVGLGAFNMISTYINLFVNRRGGYTAEDAGILGALMLLGGIIGAILMSALSDKFRKRKLLLLISIFITLVSLCVLSFTTDLFLLDLFGFLFGFGILSAGPVALEYAAEITQPVPEVSSNGILMMVGQIGGILFITVWANYSGDYFPAIVLLAVLTFIIFILAFFLKEAKKNNL